MVKIAALSENKQLVNQPSEWLDTDFNVIVRAGKNYKVITSFDDYFTIELVNQFDFVFDTQEDFQKWIKGGYLNPVWEEPDWIYRIFVSTQNTIIIADQYPEMLVNLNTPPRNPKIIVPEGSVIYLNNIGESEMQLLGALDIVIENKSDYEN
jgi:hypothetical protein